MKEWFYEFEDEAKGPVSPEQLNVLLADGTLYPATLVWAYGLPDWKPCSEARNLLEGVSSEESPPKNETGVSQTGKVFGIQPEKGLESKKLLLVSAVLAIVCFGGVALYLDRVNSEKADAAYASAKDFEESGDHEKALERLDQALALRPQAKYYFEKALIYVAENKRNEACFNFEKAVEQEPNSAFYAYNAGTYFLYAELYMEKGLELLRKSTGLDPRNSKYIREYGITLSKLGRYDEAVEILENLKRKDPENYLVWNDLASTYFYKGEMQKALQTRLEAVKKYPKDAYHWYWLANAHEFLNEKEKAVKAYQKSIALAPDFGASAAERISALTGEKLPEMYREIIEDTIPATFGHNRVLIEARINGAPGTFLLDTGATHSVVYKRFLNRNGLEWDDDGPTGRFVTAGGNVSAPITYSDMEVGRFKLSNVEFAVFEDPSAERMDGIIGMNALGRYNIKLDNMRQRLILSMK